MKEISIEEKIDYIYDKLRAEEKKQLFSSILKWGTRSLIPIVVGYMYFFGIELITQKITDSVKNAVKIDTNLLQEKGKDTWNTAKKKLQDLYERNTNNSNY